MRARGWQSDLGDELLGTCTCTWLHMHMRMGAWQPHLRDELLAKSLAVELSQVRELTGREAPTVIT